MNLTTAQQKRGMRNVILAQCFGAMADVMFQNGVLLTYFAGLGFKSSQILALLAIPQLVVMVTHLPAAYVADRFGMKRLGIIGHGGTVTGYLLMAGAASVEWPLRGWLSVVGAGIFGLGSVGMGASWFALLNPIVPVEMRGRFFGTLRISWQSVTIGMTFAISILISRHTGLSTMAGILVAVAALQLMRLAIYTRLPEVHAKTLSTSGFIASLKAVLRAPDLAPFCGYVLLMALVLGATPSVLALLGKDVLGFTESQIVRLGTVLLLGSIAGFWLGGRMTDAWGTKPVFFIGHFLSGFVLSLALVRHWVPLAPELYVGVATFLLGTVTAARGIAVTSEQLALLPKENASLASSLASVMLCGGVALSSLLVAKVLDAGVLAETWMLWGREMSAYDTLLAGAALASVLTSVTLAWYRRE